MISYVLQIKSETSQNMSGAFFYEHIVDAILPKQDSNNNETKSDSVKKPKKK